MFIVAIGEPNGSMVYHGPFHNGSEAQGYAQGIYVAAEHARLRLRVHVARLTEPGGAIVRPPSIGSILKKEGE